MDKSLKSAFQLYLLMSIISLQIFEWTTVHFLLTFWLMVLYLILPQYLHIGQEGEKEHVPKPLSLSRLMQRVKLEPHIELIPLAFVESVRVLLY